MIRQFLPTLLLSLLGLICVLACVGALTAAAILWLSGYWGPVWASLATAGGYALLTLLIFGIMSLRSGGKASRPVDPVHDLIEGLWESRPYTLMAVAGLTAFLVAKKPALVTRIAAAAARSASALAMLKRLL